MIQTISYSEKHKNVLNIQFGTGDIMFTKIQTEEHDGSKRFGLAFTEHYPKQIGTESNEYAGKNVDDFNEEIKMALSFDKPESITALIHSLIELQQAMFKGNL
jgi:hypothetical protein